MSLKQASQMQYTVIFEPAEEGGYLVNVPSFGGVITEGDTLEEAREMAKDALEGLIETYIEVGKPLPKDMHQTSSHRSETLSITISVDVQ